MISQDVTIPVNGSNMQAYLARPEEGSGPHPAVIVLQEIFGFTPETRRVTDMLAGIGYAGLAINYFHRTNPQMSEPYTEEGVKNAEAIAASVTAENVRGDVQAAIAWLNGQPFVKNGKIAAWGFGYGADLAFVAAGLPELRGTIAFYPMHVSAQIPGMQQSVLDLAAGAQGPLLAVFGDQDYYVPRYDIDQLAQTLRPRGRDACVEIYPNVGHSFFRHGRPQAIMELQRYSDEAVAQAVADAWNMVRKFLDDVFTRPPRHAAETGDIRTENTRQVRA